MKHFTCEMCGSHDLVKDGGLFVCQFCGCKYSAEEAKKIMLEGPVVVDNSQKIENLYQLARRAKAENNNENGYNYYQQILLECPNDWEAVFYTSYFKACSTTIANIELESSNLQKATISSLDLISNSADGLTEEHLSEISERVSLYAKMILAYLMKSREERKAKLIEAINRANRIGLDINTSQIDADDNRLFSRYHAIIILIQGVADHIKNVFVSLPITHVKVAEMYKLIDIIYNDANDIGYGFKALYAKNDLNCIKENEKYIQEIDSDYSSKSITKEKVNQEVQKVETKSHGCYIATSVYGSYDCPPVWTLRRFRDNTLAQTWYGRVFIHTYYAVSPTLVKYFGNTIWFKKLWKPQQQ